ncbi:wax ester/triacylglycerol synthase family O-acyltransferase [Aggregicoccus sp. 17bor-14]|uniref:wax ester/triacylglycerol synthase family O-acyltransferase n=1 Tax=Myxococcaceae TaxID=31 RepID=UPI00129CBB9F|nr:MULTISPECIES: wax ester/triacylglycerol synthase family O-acyltransferase [Myxococcaceae]MBF5045943.1 wax ester/triacylglycerol synthase family O-acyltransferase [Simulacricoccus sp. 17bor-14]MRI91675.1 wax ester/triacylglycerol synthase family O-acyltransferase [Aggregicoccus sp. 17bor-14]
MSERTRMADIDAAWLHLEEPTNLMMITGLLWFETRVDLERLKATLQRRLVARFPRFAQRVVMLGGAAYWETDPALADPTHPGHAARLAEHFTELTLEAPGDRTALAARVSALMSTPLPRERALWHFHVLHGYAPDGAGGDGSAAGSALVVRLHHCIGDGVALARVLLSLTEDAKGEARALADPTGGFTEAPAAEAPAATAPREEGGGLSGLLRAASAQLAEDPTRLWRGAARGAQGVRALGKLVGMRRDPRAGLKGPLGAQKRAAWSAPLPLAQLKALGRGAGCTVNDVLLAAVSGALRRYLEARGHPAEDVRALVPVNLRRLDRPLPRELGNHFGLVFLQLPVGTLGTRARLLELKRRMDALKRSPEAGVTFGLLQLLGKTPVRMLGTRALVDFLGHKASAVMTNVPGPREPVWLAGERLSGLMFWVPQSGHLGLGVSILSYAGSVTVGIASDAGLVPDPEALVEALDQELATLRAALDAAASVQG